jgi:hypothetical protein
MTLQYETNSVELSSTWEAPVAEPLKNSQKFYETGKFITVFTRALLWSLPSAISCNICWGYDKLKGILLRYVWNRNRKEWRQQAIMAYFKTRFWNLHGMSEIVYKMYDRKVRFQTYICDVLVLNLFSGHRLSWLKFSLFSLGSPCKFRESP